ncbi:MAG TPA: response regulator [Planctomycetota bacterium]|nr:response regulator [Planctomycetota bacterium]
MLGRLLIVDDELQVLDTLTAVLTGSGYAVSSVASGSAALELLGREPCDIALCDIGMSGMGGLELLREIRRAQPSVDVVLLTDDASLDGAVEAMSQGAADYLMKPLKHKEVLARIRSVLARRRLEAELQSLKSEVHARHHIHNIVADSPRMSAMVSALRRTAMGNEIAVMCGERGSGRAFLCRALHYSSPRNQEPFAFLSLSGMSVEDLRANLFGRRVGDRKQQRGQFERTRGGTIVLRDLERLPLEAQEELARAIAQGTFQPVDGDEELKIQARILITLSAPPAELLASGVLHRGFSCLGEAVVLDVPALRERAEDLPGLIEGFLDNFGQEHGVALHISSEAVDRLRSTAFPGNVAQLFAVLGQCAALSPHGRIEEEVLELTLRQAGLVDTHAWAPMAEHLGDREKLLVMRAVSGNPGRLDQAAKDLGVSRTTLWRRMRKYGIRLQLTL